MNLLAKDIMPFAEKQIHYFWLGALQRFEIEVRSGLGL